MRSLMTLLAICCLAGAVAGTPVRSALAAENHPAPAEGEASGEHHETGIPMKFKADLALWSFITFLVFFFALSKIAWKPLTAALDKREAGVERNIADAEAARHKAEQMLREHQQQLAKVQDEVKAMLDEARRDAETARQSILADAQKDAEATRSRALAEIEQAKNQALDQLFDAMSERVVSATEHVIGRSLNDGDHSRLVSEALAQVAPKA